MNEIPKIENDTPLDTSQSGKTRLIFFVAAIVAAIGFAGYAFTTSLRGTDEKAEKTAIRTDQLCAYAHQQQVDKRSDAIKGYKRIPPASRETLVIVGITLHPRRELIRDLNGKYGNVRVPPYCPQRSWPEDNRKWPKELREP